MGFAEGQSQNWGRNSSDKKKKSFPSTKRGLALFRKVGGGGVLSKGRKKSSLRPRVENSPISSGGGGKTNTTRSRQNEEGERTSSRKGNRSLR